MCQVGNTKLLQARGFTVCLTTRVPTFAVGDPVECRYRKFDGRRHHGATVRYLGQDEHGVWMGEHAGNAWSGGPRAFVTDAADVLVVPKAALWLPRRDRGSGGGGMFACCRRDALREKSLRAQRCRVLVAHPGSAALVSESVGPSSTASRGPVRTWFRHGPRCATRSSGGPHE